MKARLYDAVRTRADVRSDFDAQVVPRGTLGTVVECYGEPEGYAVDLAIPDARLAGGAAYVNVVLAPDQFDVLEPGSAVRRLAPEKRRQGRATAPHVPAPKTVQTGR